jgi:hypothetical protein
VTPRRGPRSYPRSSTTTHTACERNETDFLKSTGVIHPSKQNHREKRTHSQHLLTESIFVAMFGEPPSWSGEASPRSPRRMKHGSTRTPLTSGQIVNTLHGPIRGIHALCHVEVERGMPPISNAGQSCFTGLMCTSSMCAAWSCWFRIACSLKHAAEGATLFRPFGLPNQPLGGRWGARNRYRGQHGF